MHSAAQKLVFAGSSRLTEVFPTFGARCLDASLRPALGSAMLTALFTRRDRTIMRRVRGFRRFLVIPDIHIGDAVLTQPALTAVRDFFPDAEIDYVVNAAAAPLIEGNPEATRVLPVFSSGTFPSLTDVAALEEIIRTGRYDLCLNFSSLLQPAELAGPAQPVLSILSHGPTIVRNERDHTQINHFSYQHYRFVRSALSMVARPVREEHYRGARTTLADEAIAGARHFAAQARLVPGAPLVMYNPDGASPFTRVPFLSQQALLERIAAGTSADTTILVGAGRTDAGVGQRLVDTLPSWRRAKVRIIPQRLPLAAYAALIDLADVFVTGDTGPMHLAAARRHSRSGTHRFRNRTAVLSFFGATLPRMSGYDSSQPGYLPANQDAPSWCFHPGSRCHNITCLNKLYKTCRVVRCFEHVDVDALARVVVAHVAGLTAPAPVTERRRASAPTPV
jgi:ADP-heptose:LPS heptosyltransferase